MKKILTILIMAAACFSANTQWQQINNNGMGGNVRGIVSDVQYLYAISEGSGFYRSTNQGTNWQSINIGITPGASCWALKIIGTTIYTGTWFQGGYRSTNNGTNWSSNGLVGPRNYIQHNGNLFAVEWAGGVYKSTNNGLNWAASNSGISGSGYWPLISHNGNIFVGLQSGGVFRSTNNGLNWSAVNNGGVGGATYAFTELNGALYVGTGGSGVLRTTNGGINWVPARTGIESQIVYGMHSANNTLFIATAGFGVFRSTNQGASWDTINTGLNTNQTTELYSDGTYLYVGTLGSGISRRLLSQVVGVQSISNEVPAEFKLSQNYPNPFNPVTNINFSIPKAGNVKLTVYDALGKEITELVNDNYNAGTYNVDFDAGHLSTGVYYYKLESGEFTDIKKMVLIK
jgi:hypothetical protein